MTDPSYEARERPSRARSLHLPNRYSQLPNGYYSNDEMGVETRLRIPSPPNGESGTHKSSRHRIPSPPPASGQNLPPSLIQRRSSRQVPSKKKRVPSPPSMTRRRLRSSPFPPIPSPPPFSRQRGSNGVRSSLPAIIISTDHDRLPRPSTPPYERGRNDYLFLSDREASPERDRAQGLKRWNSEKASRPRAASDTQITGQLEPNIPTPDSTIASSLLTSSGVLGRQGYQYRPLQDSQFRLVRILPERKTMIKCEIIHYSLEEPPQYVAVSYAWGDAGDTRNIALEGSLVPIAVSLYGALEALRQKVSSVLVWVDALCIDQQNTNERTQQVRLMTNIYSAAESVAVWLGPEDDDSELAMDLLRKVASEADNQEKISRLISSPTAQRELGAVVSLFERDYWRRLWVVQEIFNATSITVYCGSTKLSWTVYQRASQVFNQHRGDLDYYFPAGRRDRRRSTQFSYSQALVYQGPGSLPDLESYMEMGEGSLLEVLRACRRKLTSDVRDKLFGILGVLPIEVRKEFPADYSLSTKEVYTEIVDYLLKTTERLDVICDAIHFPIHTGSANLPSFVPDWSHIPQTAAIGHKYNFSASGPTKVDCKFVDERLNKLEISAIYLGKISVTGMAVGTLCTSSDYLMAFLHWRAVLLGCLENENDDKSQLAQEDFCKTLCLGQIPDEFNTLKQWMTACYHVFASLLRDRLPHLPLDRKLQEYADANVNIKPRARRQFLQKHFGDRMMGRCFCRTEGDRIGMGSGFMLVGDIVVVPLGCSTPILLRKEGTRGEYRFVGDVYINRYMHGRAVDDWESGRKNLAKYVLH
ncbi:hypothetical protein N431DRAFT_429984 [Stipitochalara longipes BDJ]|nr:hypothetical protein N431DRAFT_429984 [Stipitochalara longipes BDJ]